MQRREVGPLDERVALVTGAGRGLGRSCAQALALAGIQVYLIGRTPSHLEETAKHIRKAGGSAFPMPCDVTDSAQVRPLIAGLPRLDVLVNSAGGNIPEPFVEVSEANLDTLLDLNVRAAFIVAQAAVQKMLQDPTRKQRGAVIINMSSQMGHVGAVKRSVYCMTKHAVEGLTKAMAVELAPHNIRVNAVAPTFIETPMTKTFFQKQGFREWVLDRIPLGRMGEEREVASVVAFLASPAASLMTGASLRVDGGWTAQ